MISKKGEKYMEAIVIVGLFVIGVFALFLWDHRKPSHSQK